MTFEGHEMTFALKIKSADRVFQKEWDILVILLGYMTLYTKNVIFTTNSF